jgi:1,4-alpha-glucan branching enzyme
MSDTKSDWRPSRETVEALVEGRHGNPFGVLGLHGGGGGEPLSLRVFAPDADSVTVIEAKQGKALAELEKLDERGFFGAAFPRRKQRFAYRLKFANGGGAWEREDPYRFPPLLGDLDVYLLAEGRHYRMFEKLGAHPLRLEGVDGVGFAVWAPNARRVSVIGHFNGWDGRRHVMRLRHGCGVWELFVPGIGAGETYKFEIVGPDGTLLPPKSDPVAFGGEVSPDNASVVQPPLERAWADESWMHRRDARQGVSAPVSIYEVHAGSWQRGADGRYLSYDELAERLIPYVQEMGFTHLELLPLHEHPFTGSWGYQPTGLFAPTSRYGDAAGFQRFVQACHEAGLGVVLDWVPGHFPNDAHGLAQFDGTALYEHADPRKGKHQDWDTLIYNYGRREVANFLLANALYWLEHYHIDALRVDAVASMLYLDYSRGPGQWEPNVHGGRENLEAIELFHNLSRLVEEHWPGAQTMAEESTSWPGVSRPVEQGGLGFGYKWNMGWMHDTLEYFKNEPVYRKYHHDKLTFGLHYAFSENFVLPLSHDEVVHGKGSLLGKMPGDRWQKFANLRAYLSFMWTHPGKKLLFMGGEFGQEREWSHDRALDWELLDQPEHGGLKRLVADLNRLYTATPALHALDTRPEGFQWVDASDVESSVVSFLRKGGDGDPPVLVVCNFTPVPRYDYRIGAPVAGPWREVLNSDAEVYGGSGHGNMGRVEAEDQAWHGQPASVRLTLPPLSTIAFVPGVGD